MSEPYDMRNYPPFAVTVDLVVLTIRRSARGALELCAAMVRRQKAPYQGFWALPGGFVKRDRLEPRGEDLLEAARRELEEETGLARDMSIPYFAQLGAYGAATRDPRGNVVTVAYLAVVPFSLLMDVGDVGSEGLRAGGDATEVTWMAVDSALVEGLAFDHARILADGVERVRSLTKATSTSLAFLREPFLLPELRHVFEVVWKTRETIDPSNFHARVADPGRGRQARQPLVVEVDSESQDAIRDSFGESRPTRGPRARKSYQWNPAMRRRGLTSLLDRPITEALLQPDLPRPVLIVHVPHSSAEIPQEVRRSLLLNDEELHAERLVMTDWYLDDLFDLAGDDVVKLTYPVSRLVCDPERFEDDSREVMAARGMGVFYTATHDGGVLRIAPDDRERARLLDLYYRPHQARLASAVADALANGRPCLIIDAHSVASQPLPFEEDMPGRRPYINLGFDDVHTPSWLRDRMLEAFSSRFDSVTVDRSPESTGTFVPAAYFGSDPRVNSIMIEVNRGLYLDESSGEKLQSFVRVAELVSDAIRAAVESD